MDGVLAWAMATLQLALEAAPWLLLGLVLAGLIKAWLPAGWLARGLGGEGLGAVVRAALVGAPLPLCSCSVLPTALGLRREGAGQGPTVAFMIATPETGVDSVAITHALLGPWFALLRPVGALISAIGVGWMVARVAAGHVPALPQGAAGCASTSGCCGAAGCAPVKASTGCGSSCGSGCASLPAPKPSLVARAAEGVRYALSTLWDDLVPWLGLALLVAGALTAFVPPQALVSFGQGLTGLLLMFLLGLPMYVCATAATPVAAGLLAAGVGPGAVLVFLLAGPAANLGTLGVLKREFGGRVLAAYLITLVVITLLLGLMTEALFDALALAPTAQLADERGASPLAWAALTLLLGLTAVRWLRRRGG